MSARVELARIRMIFGASRKRVKHTRYIKKVYTRFFTRKSVSSRTQLGSEILI